MSLVAQSPRANFGLLGLFFGIAAVFAAALLTSGAMIPEPQQSLGTSIGEIARDIKTAATGVFTDGAGTTPIAPDPAPFDPTLLLSILTALLGSVAVAMGGISLFRHEPTSLAKLAIGLGLGAVVMQYAFWLALLICGTLIITATLSNIGDIFDN
jgi:hypothetical protein